MNTILSKSAKFPMSSMSITSSSSLTIKFFLEGLCSSTKTIFYLKKQTRKIKKWISPNVNVTSYVFASLEFRSVEICKLSKSNKMIG